MQPHTLRAWWAHRQGLDGTLAGSSAAGVLERSGWARSVGGVGPYLTLHARARTTREDADLAVARLDIHELPAARGCTYVVPAVDFALALRVGQPFADAPMKVARRLGVTDPEIERLCESVAAALEGGPLPPDGIRDATGVATRSLGEEGRKKGVATTLPLALGRLQASGRVRRVPVDGRLDQQRYAYALWEPSPLEGTAPTLEEAQRELARRFFSWTGPATLGEFQWFSGLGARASRAALEPLRLVPLEAGSERLMFPGDREALLAFEPPAEPRYALVASVDAMFLLRRDVASLLEVGDRERQAFDERGRSASVGSLTDLPSHAILDRGRLVGLWEYDPSEARIAWTSFVRPDDALVAAISRTETFVGDQIGDARASSLDSPKGRVPRLEALRGAGAPA